MDPRPLSRRGELCVALLTCCPALSVQFTLPVGVQKVAHGPGMSLSAEQDELAYLQHNVLNKFRHIIFETLKCNASSGQVARFLSSMQ
eukprot:5951865-Amphidinium_carterae.1